MKKLVAILLLFIVSIFVIEAQFKTTFVDTLKSVTVTVASDAKKQTSVTDNLLLLNAKVVDNQTIVNTALSESLKQISSDIATYTKEIEKRNKSDGQLLPSIFNYSPIKIKHSINSQKWIDFTMYFLALLYLFYITKQLQKNIPLDEFKARTAVLFLYGITVFIVLKFLLTIIFNGDFYVIKELINIY